MSTVLRLTRCGRLFRLACTVLMLASCGGDDNGPVSDERIAFTAAMETAPELALTLMPNEPLRGERAYGIVITKGVKTASGDALRPPAAFAALLGVEETDGPPEEIVFDADPLIGGPFPDGRLVDADGTIVVPDRIALRGLVTGASDTQQAQTFLRSIAAEMQTLHGFGTTSPIRIPTTVPLDPTSITSDTILFFERSDDGLDLEGLVAAAAARGVPRTNIALAISFPTQPIGADLRAIRSLLITRATAAPPRLALDDTDPSDGLAVGVFTRERPGIFAELFATSPDVARVAHGLMPAPNFLGANGVIDARKVAGTVAVENVDLDVVVTVPRGTGPHPVVILQHGFGGSNLALLPNAGLLAARGLATVAISAMQHGRRGNPVALLDSTPLQTRDIFRQSNSDQMQLVRLIEGGIDVDADGTSDVDPVGIGYHGISLGGLLGANLVAVEDAITAAVLTVAGGRIAGLGQAPAIRPLYAQFFAERAGLPIDSAAFAIVLDRLLELGQIGMDDGDGLNYARFWHREPFAGSAKRVLLQEGIGDDWVLNEHTEELAHAAGISAQVAVTDPAGVCGLWRFDPPDPPQGHGISGRPEVRAQAVRFLASGGTEIAQNDP